VFIAKAIVILARCRHSRDADELNLLVADRLPDEDLDAALRHCGVEAVDDRHFVIPDYVYDVHTRRGKRLGRTKEQFLRDEHEALTNASTVFVNFDEMVASADYVQPELPWG
jgi:hypothetical protein